METNTFVNTLLHNSKLKLFLFRHGKTEWNKQGLIQGSKNSPLLPESCALIRQHMRLQFEEIEFDRFFCSPYQRAVKSAGLLRPNCSKGIELCEELKEINHGRYEGASLQNVPQKWLRERAQNKWDTRWPEGESYNDVLCRLSPWIQNLPEGVVGVMGHEGVNRMILRLLLPEISKEQILNSKHPNNAVYLVEDSRLSIMVCGAVWLKNMIVEQYNG